MQKKKLFLNIIFSFILFFFMGEIGSRIFWNVYFGTPLISSLPFISTFYPELRGIEERKSDSINKSFDLLILDGSTLGKTWGKIDSLLHAKIGQHAKFNYRIFNLSAAGHTVVDSYYKYRYLQNKHFDLVMIYHGINETRANNCPAEIFKKDFSHYTWYKQIAIVDKHKELPYVVFPYTIEYFFLHISDYFGWVKYAPMYAVIPEWAPFGKNLKSAETYSEYLLMILNLAETKHEKVLLMTMAYHLPQDYTLEKFKSKSLDYQKHSCPVELWGNRDNVKEGIKKHNEIVRKIAAKNFSNVHFVDQENLIPQQKLYFDDVCHFTLAGSEKFVENILPYITDEQNIKK